MFDLNNIETNSQVTLRLPRVITATDYHEFGDIERILKYKLGVEGVYVTEVGFVSPEYVGVVHMDTESHNQLVMELTEFYRETKEEE